MEETREGLDYSQLKQQERIHFYDDVILYEDELADNGTAVLSVKIVRSQHCVWVVPLPCVTESDGQWVLRTDEVFPPCGWSHC